MREIFVLSCARFAWTGAGISLFIEVPRVEAFVALLAGGLVQVFFAFYADRLRFLLPSPQKKRMTLVLVIIMMGTDFLGAFLLLLPPSVLIKKLIEKKVGQKGKTSWFKNQKNKLAQRSTRLSTLQLWTALCLLTIVPGIAATLIFFKASGAKPSRVAWASGLATLSWSFVFVWPWTAILILTGLGILKIIIVFAKTYFMAKIINKIK